MEESTSTLPTGEALVDTAALGAGIRALRSGIEFPDGQLVLTLSYQPDGLNVRRDLVQHSLPPAVADSVQRLVFSARRRLPEYPREWGVRLAIDLGDRISYRVGPREYCPPRPRNPELEAQMRSFFSTGSRFRNGGRERDVLLLVGVLPSGIVDGAKIIRGADSGSELERSLMQHVRRYSFHPATLDGVPVYGEIEVPVRIRDR